jgi:hypothetical protein
LAASLLNISGSLRQPNCENVGVQNYYKRKNGFKMTISTPFGFLEFILSSENPDNDYGNVSLPKLR